MSIFHYFSNATLSNGTWSFDSNPLSADSPLCVSDTDNPQLVDGNVPFTVSNNVVSVLPQFQSSTTIVDVSSFDINEEDTCVPGSQLNPTEWTLFNSETTLPTTTICPEETEALPGDVLFVSPVGSGTQDGSSWANASPLAAALAAVSSGQELWLQMGTYTAAANVLTAFTVPEGTRLYGGFSGTETQRAQRNSDVATNGTVIDGQNVRRAFIVENIAGNNHVTVFDSLTIVNGGATLAIGNGAGLACAVPNATLIVRNCSFKSNNALVAGLSGGALVCTGATNLTVCNCVFQENGGALLGVNGGAISVSNTDTVRFINNLFTENNGAILGVLGGAVYAVGCDDLLMFNCAFWKNMAGIGGAMYMSGCKKNSIQNCTFAENDAVTLSGAIGFVSVLGLFSNFVMDVRNCLFHGNGALLVSGNDITLTGAVLTFVSLVLDHCIMSSTAAIASLGVLSAVSTTVTNVIGEAIDPMFVSPTTGDMRLMSLSPARNAGTSSSTQFRDVDNTEPLGFTPNIDLSRRQRVFGPSIDVGAFEYMPQTTSSEVLFTNEGPLVTPCVRGDTIVTVLCGNNEQKDRCARDSKRVRIDQVCSGDYVLAHRVADPKCGRSGATLPMDSPMYCRVVFNARIECTGSEFVHFETGSLGFNIPDSPLAVRRGHPVFVDGKESAVEDLLNDKTIRLIHDDEIRQVYTLVTEPYAFVDMQGALVKTWDMVGFQNFVETTNNGQKMLYSKQ